MWLCGYKVKNATSSVKSFSLLPFRMKRKEFLHTSAALTGAALLPLAADATIIKTKPIRFAHLTDIHVKPGLLPETGMTQALQHVQQLEKPVQFIVNGGDAIMDALHEDKAKTSEQFSLFTSILKKENSLPVYHCIGNHDVWGWFVKENKPEGDKQYGKVWVQEIFAMQNRFYSFTRGKWHFIVLDSTQLNPSGGYIARIDEEQLDWLKKELASVQPGMFTCIISHIPILSICAGLFFNKTEANGDLLIKRNLMHTDFFELKNIFLQHPHVRVCISGHIHLQDEVDYLGVKYYCNNAVSGNWWREGGIFQEFGPAYCIMELFDDGSSKRTVVKYS
jgi:3',5'-cyclic AMP phosphodiesterase CpdA